MSEFEDNLWLEVVREHGHELARAGRRGRKHRRATRPQLLAGTTVGVAAIATAAAVLFGASTSSPAFAVTRNADGTVTVRLKQPSGIAGANRRLAAMGVRAQIAAQAKTPPKLVCPGGAAPTITFDPARIAEQHVLVITPGQPSSGDAGALKAQRNAGVAAASAPGNHVVRRYPGGGKIRTNSGGNHVIQMSCP